MNFFKKYNDKGKEIPTFPAGYGRVEPDKHIPESIDPFICPLYLPSFLIHLLIEKIEVYWKSGVYYLHYYFYTNIFGYFRP